MAVKADLIMQIDSGYDEAASAVTTTQTKNRPVRCRRLLNSVAAREKVLHHYQSTLATSGLSNEIKTLLSSQGQETAAKFLSGYEPAPPLLKKKLDRYSNKSGKTNSGEYGKTPQVGIPKAMDGTKVKVTADTSDADAQLKRLAQRHANVKVWSLVNVFSTPGERPQD